MTVESDPENPHEFVCSCGYRGHGVLSAVWNRYGRPVGLVTCPICQTPPTNTI